MKRYVINSPFVMMLSLLYILQMIAGSVSGGGMVHIKVLTALTFLATGSFQLEFARRYVFDMIINIGCLPKQQGKQNNKMTILCNMEN